MENEISNQNTEEAVSIQVEDTTSEPVKEILNKELPLTKFFNQLSEQISRKISASEIIIFAAAFATLPLVDLVAKAFGSLGTAVQLLYAIIPAGAFGLGYWFSKGKVRPFSLFLHSLAAISLIMAVMALVPMIPGIATILTVPGSIAIGMPILAIVFILAAAKIPNTGASYIFATITTIIIFFLSVSQLITIPCNNAMIEGATGAQSICSVTVYAQNLIIPIALVALGLLTFKKEVK